MRCVTLDALESRVCLRVRHGEMSSCCCHTLPSTDSIPRVDGWCMVAGAREVLVVVHDLWQMRRFFIGFVERYPDPTL